MSQASRRSATPLDENAKTTALDLATDDQSSTVEICCALPTLDTGTCKNAQATSGCCSVKEKTTDGVCGTPSEVTEGEKKLEACYNVESDETSDCCVGEATLSSDSGCGGSTKKASCCTSKKSSCSAKSSMNCPPVAKKPCVGTTTESSCSAEKAADSCCPPKVARIAGCCPTDRPKKTTCSAVKEDASSATAVPKPKECSSTSGAVSVCCSDTSATGAPACNERAAKTCSDKNEVSVTALSSTVCSDNCCEPSVDVSANSCNQISSMYSDRLRAAMAKYEAMLKRGQCLCRQALEQFGVNCCEPYSAGSARTRPVSLNAPGKCGKNKVISSANVNATRCSSSALEVVKTARSSTVKKPQQTDVEKGSETAHVVLGISGMTCTGCSKKMMNILGNIDGLSNAQVVFVSGSAEFDLDPGTAQRIDEILTRIEKESGFKCSRIVSECQHLHAFLSPFSAERLEASGMEGLVSVTAQKKKGVYDITYNPRIVGARSVLPPDGQLAPPEESAASTEGKRRLINTAINTALAAVLTIPVVVLEWSDNPIPRTTRSIVTLVLATLVQAIAVPEFYVGALKSLIYSHVIEMDMLVVISITAAYVYSVVAFALVEVGIEVEQEAFFETSTLLITLVLLGRLMAAWARMRAVSAVSLRSMQVETAQLLSLGAEITRLDARMLEFGDTVVVAPHCRIVTDGEVDSGTSAVDESMVTGESIPVAKEPGCVVIAGTMNGNGTLNVRLTRLPGENSITDIANLVENAVAAKPRVQELADKVASWFIPVVVVIAVIVFCIWVAVAIRLRNRDGGGAVGMAITYAVAVLAVSCPCALGLAVPMVLVIAAGVSARAGVIIKAADVIERGHQVTDVVFDKTGTLTEGDLQVVHEMVLPNATLSKDAILALGKAMVDGNEHPVSAAVAAHLTSGMPTKISVEDSTSIPGAGIVAQYAGSSIKAGNPHWLNISDHPEVLQLFERAMTVFCMTIDEELVLIYGLKSTVRPNAAAVVAELRRRGINCHIVSGDNFAVVNDVARVLNIPEPNLFARSSPAEKQNYVNNLQTSVIGQDKKTKVLFIGDGTNDAVAIAQADVGVQMGSASDVTSAAADVVLLSKNLDGLLMLLDLSKAAVVRIRFNFIWSAVYNLFAILLASGASVKVRIPPAYAGLGEIVSVAPVVLAAMSLMWGKKHVRI